MSFRTSVTVLGSILVLLLAAFVLGTIFAPGSAAQRAADAPLFPGLRPSAVNQIEIRDASGSVLVRKDIGINAAGGSSARAAASAGGEWRLDIGGAAYPASQARADAFVNDVAGLKRGTLVTRNASSITSLGLDPGTRRHVFLRGPSGDVLAEMAVGNAAAGSQEMYVQAAGRKEVYLTAGSLSNELATDRAYWGEMRILPAEVTADSIIRLSVERKGAPRASWTATRERNGQNGLSWVLEGDPGAKVQQDKLSSLAASAASFSGSDFLMDAHLAPDPSTAQAQVTVTGNDDRTYTLLIGARQADARYPCVLVGGAYAWLAPEWRVQEILLAEKDLTSGSQ